MSDKRNVLLMHVMGGLAFLSLPVVLSPGPVYSSGLAANPFFLRDIVVYSLLLAYFYLNYYFLIPQFYFRKDYLIFFGLQLFLFVTIVGVAYAVVFMQPPTHGPFGNHAGQNLLFEASHVFFHFVAVAFISLTLRINQQLQKSRRERINAELAYLKAQINPHFLFNTLNTIYSLSIQKADDTPDAVLKLSGLMRYVMHDAHNDIVPLSAEVTYLRDYIDLHKLRLGDTVQLEYGFSGDFDQFNIAPLLLVPLVENAFKYGVNPDKKSEIAISLCIEDETLYLRVFNFKVTLLNHDESRERIGLGNTISRLNLLYAGKHKLVINESEQQYEVLLNIELR